MLLGLLMTIKYKVGKKFNRVKVYPSKHLTESFLKNKDIKEIIVSIQKCTGISLDADRRFFN